MPVGVVRSKDDERHWTEAKKQAAKQGHSGDYAYIMGIFKQMTKAQFTLRDREADVLRDQAFTMPPVKKSPSTTRLQKAAPSASAFKKPDKPIQIPKGMKFGGGGAGPAAGGKEKMKVPARPAHDKPPAGFSPSPASKPGAVQGSVVKPPPGFTPIPHSKKGGYHKQMGGGKFMYWYPGQGIVGQAHDADSAATPHQEATAKHVMDQITALEQKGSITRQELEHTQAAIRNAWPAGPQDTPRHIMEHYQKLQGMVGGAEPAGAEPAAEKPGKEPAVPEVKIKRPGEEPMTTKELRAKMEAKKHVEAAKKETKAAAKDEKRKSARAAVITDPKKVPEGFNKLDKMARAKLTANWDQVKEDLDNNYAKVNYMSHPDMRQAITEHVDELAEAGQIVPANAGRAKGMLLKQLEYGEKAGIKKEVLAALMEENTRKLAHQEVESVMRTLGDHGVRHLEVNAHQANRIFDKLEAAGIKISPMDRFMSHQVMLDHDMGYTIPVIARGGFAIRDNYHPQASAVLVQQQADKYRKLFGAKGFKEFTRHVETHSGSGVDWKKDPVGSAVRLADNTHLFADKLPEVLFDTNAGVEVLTKIKLADQLVPKSLETVDDKGNVKKDRTPEEKAEFKALIGGIKGQLAEAIKARGDLPESTKKLLAKAVDEIGALTPQFMISRLAGRSPEFEYDKKSGDMKVNIEQSPAREAIGEIFGDDQQDKQFTKMLEDFGQDPSKAFGGTKPPQAQLRVGDKGNGIDFSWTVPKGDHPTERRYAQVMRDTKARLGEIQAMKGPAKSVAIKKFFGSDLAKSMAALIGEWKMMEGLEELKKATGGPFIGPRGGKWADAKHTIPWREAGQGREKGAKQLATAVADELENVLEGISPHFGSPDIEFSTKNGQKQWGVLASISSDVPKEKVVAAIHQGLGKYKGQIASVTVSDGETDEDDHLIDIELRKALDKAGGEGSRGGKVIGHTASGRPIYQTSGKAGFVASAKDMLSRLEHHPPGQEGLHYRAYLRAIAAGRPSSHLKQPGAQQAREDLMHHFGSQKPMAKSAMSALAARSGRARPSPYASMGPAKPSLKERLSSAVGRRPPGTGWSPVPGGKKGGFRKMVGGTWRYWYPGMAAHGGSQAEAEKHQATKEVQGHEKEARKWQERAAKRSEQGQAPEHVESARAKMHAAVDSARKLREKHGITKSSDALELERFIDELKKGDNMNTRLAKNTPIPIPTTKACKGKDCKEDEEDKLSKPTAKVGAGDYAAKSVMVGTCQVHLDPDAALAKMLEDGEMGIGTVARTFSSKTMVRKSVGGESVSEHGQDFRESAARAECDANIIRMDPAGNCGNGGIPEWFKDAQQTQEPMVRTPAVMSKAQEPPTRVIDDDDPYTRRLHQADPRDAAQADINYLYNRDAKRTE